MALTSHTAPRPCTRRQYIDDLGLTDMAEEQRNRCFLDVNKSGNGRITFDEFTKCVSASRLSALCERLLMAGHCPTLRA